LAGTVLHDEGARAFDHKRLLGTSGGIESTAMESASHIAFLNLDLAETEGLTPSPELVWRVKKAGAAAIERILTAVGKNHVLPGLDREALRVEIGHAYFERRRAFDPFRSSGARERLKRLRSMHKAAKKLRKLIDADSYIEAAIDYYVKKRWPSPANPFDHSLPLAPPPAIRFLEQLELAIADCEQRDARKAEKWRNAKRDPRLDKRRPTEKDILAGVLLPLLFERNFLRHAGRSRGKSGPPSGPMVRFISAVMQELGLPYSDEAIVRAYTRRAPLRAQRRRGGDIVTEINRPI
jgi:hypothetical protein